MTLHGLLALALGAVTPVPRPTGPGGTFVAPSVPDRSGLIAALVIGIPSVIIAISTYWLAIRAKRETDQNERDRLVLEHAGETQKSWQAHIDDLQSQVDDLRAERDGLKRERDDLKRERDQAYQELARTQRRVTAKRHELDDLDNPPAPGGQDPP